MAYTLIFTGEKESQTAELVSELTVGRTSQNNVVLSSDQGVSRKHCRFFVGEDGQPYVEDLGSANGVQINGANIEPSKPVRFSTNHEISIGKTVVKLATAPESKKRASSRESPAALARRDSKESAQLRVSGRSSRSSSDHGGSEAIEPAGGEARHSRISSSRIAKASKVTKATARGKLKCIAGPMEGETFDLGVKPRLIIGRVPPADIVLKNMSVARKHAEIYKVGSCYNINNLGDPGATKVNGQDITDMQLCPGDEIVVGEFTFLYTGPGEARPSAAKSKIGPILIGVFILGVVSVLLYAVFSADDAEEYREQPAAMGKPMTGVDKTAPDVDPVRLLGRCKALTSIESSQLNFKEAVDVCAKVLELDPSLTEARSLLRLATNEVKFDKMLDEAKLKSSTSQDEAAIDILVQIETSSFAFSRARQLFNETVDRLSKRMRTQCLTETSSGSYKAAYDACLRYRELTCNTQDDDKKVMQNFALAARKTKSTDTFVCPDKYKIFGTRVVYDDSGIEKTILRMYSSNAFVGKKMVEYYNTGRPKKIADELKRAKQKNPRNFDVKVDDLILKLEVIDGRYTSGQEGALRKDAGRAESYWKDAFEAESTILPSGINSALVRDMKGQLAKLYFNLGEELSQKEHYAESFKAYYTGHQYDPKNRELLEKIAWLESMAVKLLRESRDCASAQLAADITKPSTNVNKRAKDLLDELGCF